MGEQEDMEDEMVMDAMDSDDWSDVEDCCIDVSSMGEEKGRKKKGGELRITEKGELEWTKDE